MSKSTTTGGCPNCGARMKTKNARGCSREHVLATRRRACPDCGYACTTHEVVVADSQGFANDEARRVINLRREIVETINRHFGGDIQSAASIASSVTSGRRNA